MRSWQISNYNQFSEKLWYLMPSFLCRYKIFTCTYPPNRKSIQLSDIHLPADNFHLISIKNLTGIHIYDWEVQTDIYLSNIYFSCENSHSITIKNSTDICMCDWEVRADIHLSDVKLRKKFVRCVKIMIFYIFFLYFWCGFVAIMKRMGDILTTKWP